MPPLRLKFKHSDSQIISRSDQEMKAAINYESDINVSLEIETFFVSNIYFMIYTVYNRRFASNWLQCKCCPISELKGFDVLLIGPSSPKFQLQSAPTVQDPNVSFGAPCNLQAASSFNCSAICSPPPIFQCI